MAAEMPRRDLVLPDIHQPARTNATPIHSRLCFATKSTTVRSHDTPGARGGNPIVAHDEPIVSGGNTPDHTDREIR